MKSVDLSSFSNPAFKVGKSVPIQVLWYLVNALIFKSYLFPFSALKVVLLRFFDAKVGNGVVIKPNVNIKYPWKLEVGNYCWIGEGVWIDNLALVKLGNNVCVSQGAYLLTGNHNYKSSRFDLITKPIQIDDGAWIGAKCIVCPGTIVGQHAVLTVASVASGNVVEHGIYQGNPAKQIKTRTIE